MHKLAIPLKIIDKLILKAYLGPFFATLGVLQFVFLMQFLWKHVDDLVGKGLDMFVIFELLYYANFSLIPLTLPLSVLLSAIMSMGSLSENNELTALKSSGITFLRILRPLLFVSIFMSGIAFIFSNHLMPWSTLKYKALKREIIRKKLDVNLKEGVFNTDLDNYSIRIRKKEDNAEDVKDVTIYKFSGKGNTVVVKSKTGKIHFGSSRKYLLLDLYDGYNYEESYKQHSLPSEKYKHSKTYFKHQLFRFDLSSFALKEANEDVYGDYAKMMSFSQLKVRQVEIKAQAVTIEEGIDDRTTYTIGVYDAAHDSLQLDTVHFANWDEIVSKGKWSTAMNMAKSNVSQTINRLKAGYSTLDRKQKHVREFTIEKHKKFTLSISVFILFLVGAPLGAMIKKGGMGLPIVISVVFFLVYYMLSVYGEKSVLKNQVNEYFGMWLTNAIFLPFGILFMFQSATDTPIFDRDFYKKKFKKWLKKDK